MEEMMPVERVESRIYLIRGQKVMLDRDLAELYRVKPIRLREQVKRNIARFPADFMFKLDEKEAENMLSQNAIPSRRELGGHLPLAFTEHGILMLSSALKSDRAVQVNIMIMRAFMKLRQTLAQNKELAEKFQELEGRVGDHETIILQLVNEINKIKNPDQVLAIGFDLPKRSDPPDA
jgi:hypothetical protein